MNFVLIIIATFYRSESAASSYAFNRVDNKFVFFDQFGNQIPDCTHFIPTVPLIPMARMCKSRPVNRKKQKDTSLVKNPVKQDGLIIPYELQSRNQLMAKNVSKSKQREVTPNQRLFIFKCCLCHMSSADALGLGSELVKIMDAYRDENITIYDQLLDDAKNSTNMKRVLESNAICKSSHYEYLCDPMKRLSQLRKQYVSDLFSDSGGLVVELVSIFDAFACQNIGKYENVLIWIHDTLILRLLVCDSTFRNSKHYKYFCIHVARMRKNYHNFENDEEFDFDAMPQLVAVE